MQPSERLPDATATKLAQLASIVESSEDAIISEDLSGKILTWNRGAAAIYGYSAEEAIGRSIDFMVPPDHVNEEELMLAKIRGGGRVQHFETVRIRKGGAPVNVSLTISPILEGERVVGASHVARDITERKRLEVANARLAAIVESSEDAIISKDLNGVIETWNRSAERIYGYAAEEAIGRNITFLLPEGRVHEEQEILAKLRRGERVQQFETTRVRKDGKLIDVCLSVWPIRDAHGEMIGVSHVASDISERKELREQLRQTQWLESLGVLAGGVAHDFNNLLTGIIGNASLISESLPEWHPVQGRVQDLLVAAEQAAHLTKQLLAYSGKGQVVVGPVNVSEVAAETSRLIKSSISQNVVVHLDLDGNVPMIRADRTQIQQVITNLLINSAEAIGEHRHGTVLVRTYAQQIGESYIREVLAGAKLSPGVYVCIEVRDDGCGMDEKTRARIFEPFFTTKFTGRGLGLAAALGIVNAHHGAIRVYSAPNKGTTIKIFLPAINQKALEAADPSRPPKGVILVVDDEEVVQRVAKLSLEAHGYRVIVAANGSEAVERFREMRTSISLIILDLSMPLMGGPEALRHLRSIHADVPVVLSSGYSETEARRHFANDEPAGFIQKPYTGSQLRECVDAVLAQAVRHTRSAAQNS